MQRIRLVHDRDGKKFDYGPTKKRKMGKVWLHFILLASILATYFFGRNFYDSWKGSCHDGNARSDGNVDMDGASFYEVSTVVSDDLPLSAETLESLGLSPGQAVTVTNVRGKKRQIKGRFLHITDMHPDLYYKEGSSIGNSCHRGEPEDDADRAARFGNAMAGCDGSPDLMDFTLNWIQDHLADKIDFIIWTGDNVRHDNDREIPRTEAQIFDLNRKVSEKFVKLFKNHDSQDPYDFDVKVIPSLGNNDVFPHNMFSLGPTLQTRELFSIWSNFIPPEQQNTFDRSTSFFIEVIPGKLAVISLNTLYMFKGNPLVDDCSSKKQPGYELLLWFGYTLQELRERNMKVWLSGHVPPILKNYDSTCANKFALWLHEYNDVIVGGVFGHMNLDHFVPVDGKKAWDDIINIAELPGFKTEEEFLEDAVVAREIRAQGAKPVNKGVYMNTLRDSYYGKIADRLQGRSSKDVKKDAKDEFFERYSIVQVGTSIIPTFNPGFRVWEYNISALQSGDSVKHSYKSWTQFFKTLEFKIDHDLLEDELELSEDYDATNEVKISGKRNKGKKGRKGRKGRKDKNWWKNDKTIPQKKPVGISPGPAYINQLFSPTKFVQYYADLKQIDKDYRKLLKEGKTNDEAASKAFQYQIEYTSKDEPYPMDSLLVKDYIELASNLANDDDLWMKFLERAYCSSGYKD